MKITQGKIMVGALVLALATTAFAQNNLQFTGANATPGKAIHSQPLQEISVGTYYLNSCEDSMPPYPCDPYKGALPVTTLDSARHVYLIMDTPEDYAALQERSALAAALNSQFGMSGDSPEDAGQPVNNYEKFMEQSFSVIDTNDAAANNTSLYNALLAFANDTNTSPTLQVLPYQSDNLIFRANHFDYSGETARDFALVVNDTVDCPFYKNIDLSNPTNNNRSGWLIQGTVPNWKVTDPMYLIVSNISHSYNAFFRVIPYGGPQIQLSGAQPNATVSGIISLQTTVTDLSGITNEQFEVTVDGLPTTYNIGPSNTINLDTKYNYNGPVTVYANAVNNPQISDPTNPPDNAKIHFSGSSSLPLDFENDTYLAWANDYCSRDVGTNYIYFVVGKAQNIEAIIYDPSNGQIVAMYGGYVPYPATVVIPWDFTEADGVTAYTNDTYVVAFTAYDPSYFYVTNHIDRGVRVGAGCFYTYEEEDPTKGIGILLNQQADQVINQTLVYLYLDMYYPWGLTWYGTDTVGTNRNYADCIAMTKSTSSWASFMVPALSNLLLFSDLTIAQAHGSGATIGGGPYISDKFYPWDLQIWLVGPQSHGPDWRLRKAALWTCYSGDISPGATGGGLYPSFPDACGIAPMQLEQTMHMRKNCGLFFGGLLPQTFAEGAVTAQVAAFLDQAWICGPDQYPGGCDPTYSFYWAVTATIGEYPDLMPAEPRLFGLPNMIYSSVYDDELMMLNFTHVKQPH